MSTGLPDKLTGFNRVEFEDTCRRRFFFGLAFDPYGGTAGLYDLGPPMCAMKANMLAFWRQHFVLEQMPTSSRWPVPMPPRPKPTDKGYCGLVYPSGR